MVSVTQQHLFLKSYVLILPDGVSRLSTFFRLRDYSHFST